MIWIAVLVGWLVVIYALWALSGVYRLTFTDPPDMIDEVEQERQFLEAVQRAARS